MRHGKRLSRRIVLAGGASAAALGAGVVDLSRPALALSPLPDEGGTAPWDYWQNNQGEGVVRIVSAAILSANPYNSQPWLFRLNDSRIDVLANPARNLGMLDALRRELYIGLGCAIENACVVAPSQGLVPQTTLIPDPLRPDLAAVVELRPGSSTKHRHHDAIALRHTHRGRYRADRAVARDVLGALSAQVSSADVRLVLMDAASPEGKAFADLTGQATAKILDTAELREGRHIGIREGLSKAADIDAAFKKADADWLETTRTISCSSAAAFGLIMIAGPRGDHRQHIEAGRLWQRVHLEGTVQGLAMQPMNHLIETIDYEVANQRVSSVAAEMKLAGEWNGWEPIFGFRLGYADNIAPRSPRRPLARVVVS